MLGPSGESDRQFFASRFPIGIIEEGVNIPHHARQTRSAVSRRIIHGSII